MTFCTLFDSLYLDKGIALYRSLERVTDDFTLYIFCFDDKSKEVIEALRLRHAVAVHHSEFEDEELLRLKKERSGAEYCWTCTTAIIEYVLDNFDVSDCTYLDSDLYFYKDPKELFDEIEGAGADTCIVEHRFKDDSFGRRLEKRNGRYCVEFNYFTQSDNSRKILAWWRDKCREWCFDIPEPDRMGDQKYLNKFPQLFSGVHVLKNPGGGVAPWNLEKYRYVGNQDEKIATESDAHITDKEKDINVGKIKDRDKECMSCPDVIRLKTAEGKEFDLIFYHFQNIRYMPGRYVNIKSQTHDKGLKYRIYIPYLKEIEKIRGELREKFCIDLSDKMIVRSSNRLLGTLQKYLAAFKIRHISDVLSLNKLDKYEKKYCNS